MLNTFNNTNNNTIIIFKINVRVYNLLLLILGFNLNTINSTVFS
jgi:hypothetical protein